MTRPSFSLKCGVCEHAEPKNFNAINEKNGKIFPFSITSTQNGTFVWTFYKLKTSFKKKAGKLSKKFFLLA